jgi:glycosyltransferase involved in cell wall biosynthesis
MKVKNIIKDSIWRPGKLYDPKAKPAISVLLPTFRRGKSGLFRRAVQSVLDQTLRDIELIIIDDASSDGTADQIKEFMRKDGRVSVITHPRNIGLPAISEYEGFMRARADYIGFAFDDDLFYPDALEQLLKHGQQNPGKVCYGHVVMRILEPGSTVDHHRPLGQDLALTNLRSSNVLANTAVLLPRRIIEEVGFYDPRVAMARQCDWDLWRRIGDKYLLQHVDVAIGEVDGPATTDSLGMTYLLDSWASEALMRSDRTVELRPGAFEDIDIASGLNCEPGSLTKAVCRELTSSYLARRPWLDGAQTAPSGPDGTILVLTSSHEASTSLCFDYLPKAVNSKVRVICSRGPFGPAELARASCLVVVRYIETHNEWRRAAKLLGIPIYYFLDDNIPELVGQKDLDIPEDMSRHALRERLRTFDGVLLTSKSLVQYFEEHLIHPKLFYFPPSYAGTPITTNVIPEKNKRAARAKQEAAEEAPKHRNRAAGPAVAPPFALTVASAGGVHRHAGLNECVIPALQRLAANGTTTHLIVGGCTKVAEDRLRDLGGDGLTITCLPLEIDWKRLLLQLARYKPDILVHGPSNTVNNKYKTLNAGLTAYLLDAVLVAPDQTPFNGPEFSKAAVRVNPSEQPKAWLDAIELLLRDRESWSGYKAANAAYCQLHFSGDENVSVLNSLLAAAPPVGFATVEARLKLLYWAKGPGMISSGKSTPDLHSLSTSLSELARLRQSHRRYRSLRFPTRRDDLWPSLSPAFADIRDYIVEHGIRKRRMALELSDSLHDRVFAEYKLSLPPGSLESVTCAFASEGMHSGLVGLEIVSPEGQIVLHEVLDLSNLDLHLPVRFDTPDMKVRTRGQLGFRFFARSDWPLYILEFASYGPLGLRRHQVVPFARFDYAEDA